MPQLLPLHGTKQVIEEVRNLREVICSRIESIGSQLKLPTELRPTIPKTSSFTQNATESIVRPPADTLECLVYQKTWI